MQRTKELMTYLEARFFTFFGIPLIIGVLFTPAAAQTLLSPAPIMPLQNQGRPAGSMPAVASTLHEEAENELGNEKVFHIPLILNESVESQIEFFTTRGRSIFQNWLRRSARYLPLMKQIFREYNLPEDLVYVAMIESGFNPHAVSPQKAVGPWQFMQATGREYGLNINGWVDERKDPVKSTRAAAAHLKSLYNTFGSWLMALASYNAGTGRMQGAVLKARSDDFWELCASRFIHMETQEYVPRYLAALIIAKNPLAYGFSDVESEPFEFEEVVVPRSTDLRKIAQYAGSSYEELRELNPELLRHQTPQNRYVLRLPPGTKGAYQLQLAGESGRERKKRADRDEARKGGLLFSRQAAGEPAVSPGRKNPPIVSPYAAQLDSYHAVTGYAEALLSSDRAPFPVFR